MCWRLKTGRGTAKVCHQGEVVEDSVINMVSPRERFQISFLASLGLEIHGEKYRQTLIHHAVTTREAYDWPQPYSAAATTPNIQTKSLRTIFNVKKDKKSPQSPDLNIIESLWDYMKGQKDLRKLSSTDDVSEQPISRVPSKTVDLEKLMLFWRRTVRFLLRSFTEFS